ncbi:FkbM family methyltransferase [Flavobacterium sp. TMP13]|uniref:FkbM family methyltransferase n=1 Tax=Flavobacterium sp. TMP13 TaxID=3425950 RepID=UPI003D77C3AF
MDNKIFKRPLYKIAGKISKILRNFQKREDDKLVKRKNELWDNLFKDNVFFEFKLTNDVKINLYKDSVLSKLIYNGFEKEETDYLYQVLNEGDVFLDIGANVGLFALIASNLVGANGKVICFEPSPLTFARLAENVKLNDFKNIELKNIGLGETKDQLNFYLSENGHDAWNSFAPSQDNKLEKIIQVPVSTLDIELQNVDKEKVSLVKMDVEGWEKFALKGGREFLINFSPIVMVEFTEENTFNAGYSVHEIYDIMITFGYQWFTIKNGKLIEETKKLHYPYNNLIAIKKQ